MNTYHSIGCARVQAPDHGTAAADLARRHAGNRWPGVAGVHVTRLTHLKAIPDDGHVYSCTLNCPLLSGGTHSTGHIFTIYQI